MKSIEIITTQNVVLQYELATLRDRAIAFMIDFMILMFAGSILFSFGISLTMGSETAMAILSAFIGILFMCYTLIMESLNKGQTIGKMALHLQVVRVSGGQAMFSDYAARWIFRLIDIYMSLGSVAAILVVSSPKGQRIGDVVGNTAVVKRSSKAGLNLQELLALHQRNGDYTPTFPQARKLQEADALLIKSTLDRYRKYNNPAHREALLLLAQRIEQMLDIQGEQGLGNDQFLTTVLQDYVVLSR